MVWSRTLKKPGREVRRTTFGYRPRLELLEDRLAPALFTVNAPGLGADANLGDGLAETLEGTTTLQAAIEEANVFFFRERVAQRIEFDLGQAIQHNGQAFSINVPTEVVGNGQVIENGPLVINGDDVLVQGIEFVATQPIESVLTVNGERAKLLGNTIRSESIDGLTPDGNIGVGIRVATQIVGFPFGAHQIGGTGQGERNQIGNASQAAIELTGNANVHLVANTLGEVDGTAAPNESGLLNRVALSSNVTVGQIGSDGSPANVIVNSTFAGIDTVGNVVIEGNFLGLREDGRTAAGNNRGIVSRDGIGFNSFVIRNNVISANAIGILLNEGRTPVTVHDNLIGTDHTGRLAVGNDVGIEVGRGQVTITKSATGSGNVISGNTIGIFIASTVVGTSPFLAPVQISSNRIGTDITGTTALGNAHQGIRIEADNIDIIDNLIADNGTTAEGEFQATAAGIAVLNGADDTLIRLNTIGTDELATANLGNATGILLGEGVNNSVVNANTIVFNEGDGIRVLPSSGNDLRDNILHSNDGLAIDLVESGEAGPGFGDGFPSVALPTLTVLPGSSSDTMTLQVSVTGAPPLTFFEVDIFELDESDASGFGEAQRSLTSGRTLRFRTDAAGNATTLRLIQVDSERFYSAQITNQTDNTSSELSNVVFARVPSADASIGIRFEDDDLIVFQGIGILQPNNPDSQQTTRAEVTNNESARFQLAIENLHPVATQFQLSVANLFDPDWIESVRHNGIDITSAFANGNSFVFEAPVGDEFLLFDIDLTPSFAEPTLDVVEPAFHIADAVTGAVLDSVKVQALSLLASEPSTPTEPDTPPTEPDTPPAEEEPATTETPAVPVGPIPELDLTPDEEPDDTPTSEPDRTPTPSNDNRLLDLVELDLTPDEETIDTSLLAPEPTLDIDTPTGETDRLSGPIELDVSPTEETTDSVQALPSDTEEPTSFLIQPSLEVSEESTPPLEVPLSGTNEDAELLNRLLDSDEETLDPTNLEPAPSSNEPEDSSPPSEAPFPFVPVENSPSSADTNGPSIDDLGETPSLNSVPLDLNEAPASPVLGGSLSPEIQVDLQDVPRFNGNSPSQRKKGEVGDGPTDLNENSDATEDNVPEQVVDSNENPNTTPDDPAPESTPTRPEDFGLEGDLLGLQPSDPNVGSRSPNAKTQPGDGPTDLNENSDAPEDDATADAPPEETSPESTPNRPGAPSIDSEFPNLAPQDSNRGGGSTNEKTQSGDGPKDLNDAEPNESTEEVGRIDAPDRSELSETRMLLPATAFLFGVALGTQRQSTDKSLETQWKDMS